MQVIWRPRAARLGRLVRMCRPCSLAARALAAGPPGEGPRRDDANQLLDRRPDRLAEFDQTAALGWADVDAFGKLGAQDGVFAFEVLELPGQRLVGRRRQHHQKRVQQSAHGGGFRNSLACREETTFLHTAAGGRKTASLAAATAPRQAGLPVPAGASVRPQMLDSVCSETDRRGRQLTHFHTTDASVPIAHSRALSTGLSRFRAPGKKSTLVDRARASVSRFRHVRAPERNCAKSRAHPCKLAHF
jgi:hypothetical protein